MFWIVEKVGCLFLRFDEEREKKLREKKDGERESVAKDDDDEP